MEWTKQSIPQSPSEFKIRSAEACFEPNYPTASTLDTTTSVYFMGMDTNAEGTPMDTSNMDSTLQSYSSFAGRITGSGKSTPRKLVSELKPVDLRSHKAFSPTIKKGIKISTPKPPLATLPEDFGQSPIPSNSRDTTHTDILQRIRGSPGQKLSRLRKRSGSVEVQTVTLSPSPSPSSSPQPHTNTPYHVAVVRPQQPVGVVQTNTGSSSTQSHTSGGQTLRKLRLKENFTTDELVDQLLDKKTVDWNYVLDPRNRKYYLEFSKTN